MTSKQLSTRWQSSTRYLGVSTQTGGSTWHAHIFIDYRSIYIASFANERDAAVAHDRVALRLLGRDAGLNFPAAKVAPASVEQMRRWARQLRKRRGPDSSSFLGVSRQPEKPGYPWSASLTVRNRKLHLGSWKSELDAAEAHDRAVLHYLSPGRARLNFPAQYRTLGPADAESLRREALRRHKAATSSRYIGVTWFRRRNRWAAQLVADGRRHCIGYFDREEEAAWKRDDLAIKLLENRAPELPPGNRPGSARAAARQARASASAADVGHSVRAQANASHCMPPHECQQLLGADVLLLRQSICLLRIRRKMNSLSCSGGRSSTHRNEQEIQLTDGPT